MLDLDLDPTSLPFVRGLRRLARAIDEGWRARDYDDRAFAEIAEARLRGATCFDSHEDLVGVALRELVTVVDLPTQLDPKSEFSEPPVTVVNTGRFVVDVYFWLDGTPAVHQHGFSGAFRVAAGSSLHTTYGFVQASWCNQHLRFGALRRRSTEYLSRGDVRRIDAGDALIHSLFHLDRPSMSVIARTINDTASRPQLSYLAPGVAYDPDSPTEHACRAIELVVMALGASRADALSLAERYAQSVDTHARFVLLRHAQDRLPAPMFESLLASVCALDARIDEHVRDALVERSRQINLTRRRREIVDAEHRYFLALLLNVDSWGEIERLVSTRFPTVPARDKVCGWVRDLAMRRADGGDGLLGLYLDESALEVFRALLEHGNVEAVLALLRRKYGAATTDRQTDLIYELCAFFRGTSVLSPLFA